MEKLFYYLTLLFFCINTASAAEVYHFDMDNDVVDSCGTQSGTEVGDITYTAGYYNQSGVFDGVNDYFTINRPTFINKTGTYSISVWAKFYDNPSSGNTGNTIFQCSVNNADRNGMIHYAGKVRFGYYNGTAWTGKYAEVNINEWNHIVGVCDAGILKLYLNGEESTLLGPPYVDGTATQMYIGRHMLETSGFLNGEIDEFRIYNNALSSADVLDIYENSIHNAFVISAFDEINETQLNISSFTIFNSNQSVSSGVLMDNEYYVYSDQFSDSGQYILTVDVDDYYSRNFIVEKNGVPVFVRTYLIPESETVIYEQFSLVDNIALYSVSDIILRLDKPMSNTTNTIYSSKFDMNYKVSTYLIPNDAYILYLITPAETINYGWLYPDADGTVTIILNNFVFEIDEEWLQYTYADSNESVSFDYTSSSPVTEASLIVTFQNGTEAYNVSAETDTGSFTYNFVENATYFINICVNSEEGVYTFNKFLEIGAGNQRDFFPSSYSSTLKAICVIFAIVIGILGLSSYRTDLSAIWTAGVYSFSVYQGWIYGNTITIAIIGIAALAAIKKFQKKESRM